MSLNLGTMHITLFWLLFFLPSVFGISCDSWIAKVTRQWRSIFVPDGDVADHKPISPENNEMDVREFPGNALFLDNVITEVPPSIPPKFRRPILKEKEANSAPAESPGDQIKALRKGHEDRKAQEPLSKFIEELANFLIEMRTNKEVSDAVTDKLLKGFMEPSSQHSIPSQRKVAISIDL
jgi:hypothetical protein